ncbi:MAG: translation initiation factor IF-2 [Thainema sp.]
MNNGKVRIYELSRELDLDNKDVLAICDRLSISVKSHSSTISEQEAAQIRAAAKSYVPNQTASKGAKGKGLKTQSKGADKSSVRKQQILEVRRTRPISPPKPPTAKAEDASAGGDQQLSAPQAPAVRPATKSEPKLAAPPRPASADQDTSTTTDSPATEAKSAEPQVEPPKSDQADQPIPQRDAEPEKAVAEKPAPAPSLIKPPSRPSEPSEADVSTAAASEATAPSAERKAAPAAKSVEPPRKPVTKPSGSGKSDTVAKPNAKPGKVEVVQHKPSAKPTTAKAADKPIPELKRPPKPPKADNKPAQEGEPDADNDAAVMVATDAEELLEKPRLRRPEPPAGGKRKQAWEEDEEEQDFNRKAAKNTSKAKRRSQTIIEDEDELEELESEHNLSGGPAPSQVSISLARPPKPKSAQSQKTPTPMTAQKTKRPNTSSQRDGSSRSQRRERREEAKQQRPETLVLSSGLTVHELAERMLVPETEIIKTLFFKGIAANINQTLDIPTAKMVANEFEIEVETAEAEAEAKKTTEMLDAEDLENLVRRPPVVTIMGHVDHGKTTLLDSIRKTKVAQGEAGGITQHIGAYHVDLGEGDEQKRIVFLDTPGHEAFTAMRARGARVTDIAILVVAADDGVRPQTIEAISHAKAAEVPIVVAINKVDKEEANPDRVKQELMEHGLVPEEWGGDAIMVPVSAIKGENLDDLLEMLALVAEVEDLHANPDRTARGTIIEANLDKARGPVATLLVQNGTLRIGDSIVAGSVFGKVRAMVDDRGNRVDVAAPSSAVEVLGLNDVPAAGDEFEVYKDEKGARSIAEQRAEQQRQSRLQQSMASRRVTLSTLSAQAQEGELKELNLILKADVQGSVEAILGALQQLPQNEVQVRVLLAAPGEISETDVDLAAASNAVIIGFNTTLASGARRAADEAGVDVRDYSIIYKLLEDIEGAMEGLLEPEEVEEPLGQVQVRAVFQVGRGAVAGCYVQSGKAVRNCRIRVRRGDEVVYTGNLDSLKRVKDDVKEVNSGFECGIGIDNFNAWQEGDIIETFRLVTKRRTLATA